MTLPPGLVGPWTHAELIEMVLAFGVWIVALAALAGSRRIRKQNRLLAEQSRLFDRQNQILVQQTELLRLQAELNELRKKRELKTLDEEDTARTLWKIYLKEFQGPTELKAAARKLLDKNLGAAEIKFRLSEISRGRPAGAFDPHDFHVALDACVTEGRNFSLTGLRRPGAAENPAGRIEIS